MKKVALLYCGEARSFNQMWENHRWYLRKLRPAAVFVSVADDAQADDMLLLKKSFPNADFRMEKVKQPDIPEPVEETACRSGYPRSTTKQGVLRQLWALNRCWEFFTSYGDFADYDCIVRVRPDTAFVRVVLPDEVQFDGRDMDPNYCGSVWWATWGGVNDRFLIFGSSATRSFFTTFRIKDKLWDMGCPLHPEQMLAASLELDRKEPTQTLAAEFLTVRPPSPEHPNGGYFKIEPSTPEIAEYARHKLI